VKKKKILASEDAGISLHKKYQPIFSSLPLHDDFDDDFRSVFGITSKNNSNEAPKLLNMDKKGKITEKIILKTLNVLLFQLNKKKILINNRQKMIFQIFLELNLKNQFIRKYQKLLYLVLIPHP